MNFDQYLVRLRRKRLPKTHWFLQFFYERMRKKKTGKCMCFCIAYQFMEWNFTAFDYKYWKEFLKKLGYFCNFVSLHVVIWAREIVTLDCAEYGCIKKCFWVFFYCTSSVSDTRLIYSIMLKCDYMLMKLSKTNKTLHSCTAIVHVIEHKIKTDVWNKWRSCIKASHIYNKIFPFLLNSLYF